jgi:uncharacterized membrane protein
MRVFLLTLHVLAAVFVIGPLVYFPMNGLRGIRTGDVDTVRSAARLTFVYSLLSLLVFGLGAAVVAASTKVNFGTAWLTISMTLYVVAFAITLALLVPSLRQAVTLMEASHDLEKDERDVRTRSKLDSVRGRAAASAGVVALLLVVITILMVVKPFAPA